MKIQVDFEVIFSQMSLEQLQELHSILYACINVKSGGSWASQNPAPKHMPAGFEPTPSEKTYVIAGNIIAAIKSVRERSNLGLKEAKDIVDWWRAKHLAGIAL